MYCCHSNKLLAISQTKSSRETRKFYHYDNLHVAKTGYG